MEDVTQDFNGPDSIVKKIQQSAVPFQCVVEIPRGYQVVSHGLTQFMYDLNGLSIAQDTGKKTINVEDYGQIEIDLYTLTMRGCISIAANIDIKPEKNTHINFIGSTSNTIQLYYTDTISIDTVLKYSVKPFPYHAVDCNHVRIDNIQLEPFDTANPRIWKLTGVFQFNY
ncbi:hypothetical protein CN602_29430 [Bacillus cereus]|uniref:hypothetical protein n=1 Tax=Bacillus cereus TaxID=1396 RepID=UPI000BF16F0F|nr:hypothetical protein [Bacillus cereus]PEL93994.1 hypothetical protein CN602_29430 [Bacillus cereus]